jgi:hypothetical protein
MLKNLTNYGLLGDKELVERLTAKPADEELHGYFFNERCRELLKYISTALLKCDDTRMIVGELYEFLADNDWAVLRKWKNRDGASLYSYVARCSINHFMRQNRAEKKRAEKEFVPETPELLEIMNSSIEEEECETPPVWKAYEMLNERERELLRLLIIDGKSTLDASKELWKYIRSDSDPEKINPKRIQCTLSMAKHRAQLTLLEKLKSLTSN